MNFKWCVGHEVVLAWILLIKNFLVGGFLFFFFNFLFFIFFLFLLYRGFFTYHRQNACLSETDLVIPCPDVSGQHVQVRYYVLDSYYYSGHWGYIYIYKGDKLGCVCGYTMHCTLCMSYNSPLSILGYLF